MELHQTKMPLNSKGKKSTMKRQPSEVKEIFANSDRGLIFRACKKLKLGAGGLCL
jgi:hypothetical protein